MSHPPLRRRSSPMTAVCAALLLFGCGAEPAGPAAAGSAAAAATEHGYVAGAQEMDEPQLQLAYSDDAGSVHVLDLLTEESAELGEVGEVAEAASDGRFLFLVSDNEELIVVDTGTWAVDHGDHLHYYRAPARVVGSLDWSGAVRAASSETLTALFSPTTGSGVLLDRAELGRGTLAELATTSSEPHDGALVPLGNRVVATRPGGVVVLDSTGEPLPGTEDECVAPRGGAATRVGVVVSCADGAVLVTGTADGADLERIPYLEPVDEADRAAGLANRPGRPALAAPAGERGVWLLDSRARTWQLLPTPTPWVEAVAADDEADRVVGLDAAGRVVVLEPERGTWAATDPLVDVDRLDAADLQVDADRAYVNVPGADRVVEIDYADGARVARTLPTAADPVHLAETGL